MSVKKKPSAPKAPAAPRAERRVALVTGGARGIGLGISLSLARAGLDLAVCGVREESAAADAVRSLRDTGANVLYCRADVSDRAARERMLDAVRSRFGRLHILVNNAGVAPEVRADLLDATEASFDRLIGINLRGPYFLTQSAAWWMIDQRKADPGFAGCVVNVSSVSATAASVNRGDYCLSKAGVAMATTLWAVRLAEFGISVYEVRPGLIRTDMTAGVRDRYDRLIAEGGVPEKRWGTPDDVGRAVAALVRGDLPYATGQVLVLDGGLTLPRL